ncbi:MAG: hypothetical protein HOP16_17595 [Acidobacteria bacterium]|nr:hypothetical protein [Acidobacteriota bacterium]
MHRRLVVVALVVLAAAAPVRAQRQPPEDLAKTLAQVAQRVEAWYGRAQTVVATETVVIQPLGLNSTPSVIPRRLVFELRVGWEPDPDRPGGPLVASVLRQPISSGRASRRDDPGCMDPKPVSPEPLAMLLPERLNESRFSLAGTGRVDRRAAVMIDFRGVMAAPPEVTWTGECVSVSLPGRSRGRIWVDAATHDVLRIDDRLIGTFTLDVPREQVRRGSTSTMVIESAESSIRYRQVSFQDPEEALMLPVSIDITTVIRGATTQRMRISQRLSDYRRFLTGGRIVD